MEGKCAATAMSRRPSGLTSQCCIPLQPEGQNPGYGTNNNSKVRAECCPIRLDALPSSGRGYAARCRGLPPVRGWLGTVAGTMFSRRTVSLTRQARAVPRMPSKTKETL